MPNFIVSEKAYNWLKWLIGIFLPAFSALYVGLGQYFNLPATEAVVGSIALCTVFLSAITGISTKNYQNSDAPYDGSMVVTTSPEGTKQVSLELDGDPHEIAEKKSVSFKVRDDQDYAGMDLG